MMNILRNMLLAAALCLLSGCINDYPGDEGGATGSTVVLDLAVGTLAASQNPPPDELIHTLRIVLIDSDNNTIEANELIQFDSPVREYVFGPRETQPGRKKVFLIANEEGTASVNGQEGASLTTLLQSQNTNGQQFEQLVNSCWFVPDFGEQMVLTASYEFDLQAGSSPVRKTCYLVHAATKFEFIFENVGENPIRIDELKLSAMADQMYLMANLGPSEKNKTLNGRSYYWIDWLKAVGDATSAEPGLPENTIINEQYGWISNYALPDGTTHETVDILKQLDRDETYWTIGAGQTLTLPTLYFPESRYIPEGESEQQYSFTITPTDCDSGVSKQFADNILNNVKALFRNTQVKIVATFRYTAPEPEPEPDPENIIMELKIGVCPWYTEEIEIPTFD